MGSALSFPPFWTLWNMETWERCRSRLPVRGDITETLGSNWQETVAPGAREPLVAWTSGRAETITVELLFFAFSAIEEIETEVDKIKAWGKLDPQLGRPPRLLFDYGRYFQVRCVIDSIGSLRWEGVLRGGLGAWIESFVRGEHAELVKSGSRPMFGSPRIASVTVTFRRWHAGTVYTETDPTGYERSTVFHTIARGEDYETIAARRYGPENAILGVLLRQDNPQKPILYIGDEIAVPDKEKISRRTVQPQAPIFGRNETAKAARIANWQARSQQRFSSLAPSVYEG